MAYVIFTKVKDAYEAVEKLNGEYIRKDWGHPVRVEFSVNNNRLLLRSVPIEKTSDELMKELERHLRGIVKVKIFTNVTNDALVTFSSHQ